MTRFGELFAGVGGLGMAVDAEFNAEPAWFAESAPAPSKVLAYHYPMVPNHGDVTMIDWSEVEPVQILAGGFPCQDVSVAGARKGLRDGTRSGLWSEFALAIERIRPSWVVIENVGGLLSAKADSDVEPCSRCLGDGSGEYAMRALGAVLADLAGLGFDAEWASIRASDVGAPHQRRRVFILAWPSDRTLPIDLDAADYGIPPTIQTVRTLLPTPTVSDANGPGAHGNGGMDLRTMVTNIVDWGRYSEAIELWSEVIGRPAPRPVRMDGRDGRARLNPELTEWMMGWPRGWVTDPDIGISRSAQLRACGGGVVTLQARAALRELLSRPGVPTLDIERA